MNQKVVGQFLEGYYHDRCINNISQKKLRHVQRRGRSHWSCLQEEQAHQK